MASVRDFTKAFTVKTMLVLLEYIFQFFINKALSASNTVHRQNFNSWAKVIKVINSTIRSVFVLKILVVVAQ